MVRFLFLAAALVLAVLASPPPARAECGTNWTVRGFDGGCNIGIPPLGGVPGEREGRTPGSGETPGDRRSGEDSTPGRPGQDPTPGQPGRPASPAPGQDPTPGQPGQGEQLFSWNLYLPGGKCRQLSARVVPDRSGISPGFVKFTRDVPCPESRQVEKFCDRLVWTGDGLSCGKDGAFGRVEAQVSLPEVVLDVRPYPGAVVGLPVTIRLAGQPVVWAEGVVPRFPPGAEGECRGESEDNGGTPPDGTFKDVRLRLTLTPLGPGVGLDLPVGLGPDGRAAVPITRRLWVSETPTQFTFPLPSHPDARLYGARVEPLPAELDPETARAGTPAFVGAVRAPYILTYRFTYQQAVGIYRDVEEKFCGANWETEGCETRKVPHRFGCNWVGHEESGQIPAEQIQGLPAELLDAEFPGAIMNPGFVVRRWNLETGRTEEVARGGPLYWVVREVQSLLGRQTITVDGR